jgi:2-polyprenyl-3-methyl-5-hydroxy-6-metoxy-1,4-benzoquinol methylase
MSYPQEMFEHYLQLPESERLFSGVGELERERTRDILKRHLPSPPATVLDIGGAAGVHALWLAQCGYEVHLFDPIQQHVEQALSASARQPDHPIASCSVGDARRIDRADGSVEAVLLLGPLYHLTDPQDRLAALTEAHRLLKPGGLLFVATISRFASLIDGLARDLVSDPAFVSILRRDLEDGQHRNPTDNPEYFTTAFFHRPDELREEMREAGFHVEKLLGVEGPVWFMASFPRHWNLPEKRSLLLELLQKVEQEPHIVGASAHPLGIGRK